MNLRPGRLLLRRAVVWALISAVARSRRPIRRQLGGDVLIGLDRDRGRLAGDLCLVRARGRQNLYRLRLRVGLWSARSVHVDLYLLLVLAAGAVWDEVSRRWHHCPPALGKSINGDVVVIDNAGLIAYQPEHDHPLARLDATVRSPLAALSSSGRRKSRVGAPGGAWVVAEGRTER